MIPYSLQQQPDVRDDTFGVRDIICTMIFSMPVYLPRPNASFTTERLWLMTAPPINAELRLYIRILKLSITLTLVIP